VKKPWKDGGLVQKQNEIFACRMSYEENSSDAKKLLSSQILPTSREYID
jgi:hypothetical protein